MKEKKEKKLRRSPCSFRLRNEIADIISKAADELGWSDAEVVDSCVIANIEAVVLAEQAKQRALASDDALVLLIQQAQLTHRDSAEPATLAQAVEELEKAIGGLPAKVAKHKSK